MISLISLPGLPFDTSYHLDLHLLRENTRPILPPAISGELISRFAVGFLLNLGLVAGSFVLAFPGDRQHNQTRASQGSRVACSVEVARWIDRFSV